MYRESPSVCLYNSQVDSICEDSSHIILGSYAYENGERKGAVQFLNKDSRLIELEMGTSGTLDMATSNEMLYAANSSTVELYVDLKLKKEYKTAGINTRLDISEFITVADTAGRISFYDLELNFKGDCQVSNDTVWAVNTINGRVYIGTEDGTALIYENKTNTVQKIAKRKAGIIDIMELNGLICMSSYDSAIECWDPRTGHVERSFKDVGSVWRMQRRDNQIYSACMYDGFKVFDLEFNKIKEYATNSICYGLAVRDKEVVWSSFYDKTLYFLPLE